MSTEDTNRVGGVTDLPQVLSSDEFEAYLDYLEETYVHSTMQVHKLDDGSVEIKKQWLGPRKDAQPSPHR